MVLPYIFYRVDAKQIGENRQYLPSFCAYFLAEVVVQDPVQPDQVYDTNTGKLLCKIFPKTFCLQFCPVVC